MKKIKNISLKAMLVFILALGFLNSCVDDIKLLSLPYLFRPINFTATMNSTEVTFNWAKVDSAVSYTLEIAPDSANFVIPLIRVKTTNLSYVKELAGNTTFYARIRANAADSTKNSKFNTTLTFKTPKENIFAGYGTKNNTGNTYSAYMSAPNTLDIKWKPGANVTHLILTGSVRDSVAVSPTEAAAGEKIVSGLVNSNWTIGIYNGNILRGTSYGLIEGDVIITTPGDISAAITSASPNQVILLAGGTNYTIGFAEYKFAKNVKIRSTSTTNRAVVSMTTAGTSTPPSGTSNMMSVLATAIDSLVFENIDFTGYCDNNSGTGSTKIGYLFSNKVASTVGKVQFTNCNMHNFANTTFRVSGGVSQRFTSVIFNGCTVSEIGFGSTYALVNSNSADYVDNVTFSNSTFYNIKGTIVLRTGAYTMNSINITNCIFNQTMIDTGSARYVIDVNLTTITAGINIKNCIFGFSGANVGANGYRGTAVPVITGSYYSTDYVDDPNPVGLTSTSLKSKMTSYSGKSTDLWTDPVNGNFTLKDTNFAGKGVAGDLRW